VNNDPLVISFYSVIARRSAVVRSYAGGPEALDQALEPSKSNRELFGFVRMSLPNVDRALDKLFAAGPAPEEPKTAEVVHTLPVALRAPADASGPLMFGNNKVRVVVIEDEPWFVAADACECIGLPAVKGTGRHLSQLRDDEKRMIHKGTIVVPQNFCGTFLEKFCHSIMLISESGLYKLILRAQTDRPTVKAFQDWVTREVLPSIRKTGSYTTAPVEPQPLAIAPPAPQFSLPTTFSEALRELASEVERREESERTAEALRIAREADAPKFNRVN
jgi:prophage antirepressor-like protein